MIQCIKNLRDIGSIDGKTDVRFEKKTVNLDGMTSGLRNIRQIVQDYCFGGSCRANALEGGKTLENLAQNSTFIADDFKPFLVYFHLTLNISHS